MGYDYASERPFLFTEDGQRLLLAIRDAAFELISTAGAARAAEIMDRAVKKLGAAGSFEMLAALDRLVELQDIVEVSTDGWGQDRIFTTWVRSYRLPVVPPEADPRLRDRWSR